MGAVLTFSGGTTIENAHIWAVVDLIHLQVLEEVPDHMSEAVVMGNRGRDNTTDMRVQGNIL